MVNIITKKDYEQGLSSYLNGSYDSAQNGSTYTGGSSYTEGNLTISANASISDFDNRESAEGEVDGTDWSSESYDLRVDYRTEDFDVGVSFGAFDGEFSLWRAQVLQWLCDCQVVA